MNLEIKQSVSMSEHLEWSEKARLRLEEIKKNSPTLVAHYAYRYLHFEDRVDQMGGWANFKHYIVKAKDRRAIQALQKENAELMECVIDLERQVDCMCTDERTCSMCKARGKHKATIDRLLGGEG